MPEQLLPSVSSDTLAEQYQLDEPEVIDYSNWAVDNATEDDEIQNRVNYSNFVRQEYIKHGTYDSLKSAAMVENDLRNGLRDSLIGDGLVDADDQETIASLYAPTQKNLDEKLSLIKAHYGSDSEEWNVATRYQAHNTALEKSGDDGLSNPLIAEKTQQYLDEAEALSSGEAYNTALKRAVDKGELSMAVLKNDKGQDYIHNGKLLDELSFGDAMKQAVSLGNMSYSQAAAARQLYEPRLGSTIPRYKEQRYLEIDNSLQELSKSDENFNFRLEQFQEMQGRLDEQSDELSDDQIQKREAEIERMYSSMSELYPEGEEPSYEDFSAMVTTSAQRANFHQQELYEADSEDVGKNLKRIGHLAPMMTGVAMAHKETFEATIAANKSLTDNEILMLREQREELRESNFGYHNKFLKNSRVGDEWMDALTKGRANGTKDADIFDEFVQDPENYSAFSTIARGIGASVVEGFTDVLGFVAMSAGADWGKEMLLDNARDKSKRVEFQEMFGDKHGFWQQSGEMIAPVLVDMGATALLAAVTLPAAGAGGAAYLTAKTGARLSVKALTKNLTKGVLRKQAGEGVEEAAKRVLVTDLIKGSSEKVRKEGAMAAIRGYNDLLATKTLGKNAAIAIPAFNRSAGGTYASVYQKLGDDKSMSEEDRHDKAMGAAMTAGAVTAIITTGFSSLGLGGVDDALIKGATKKQMMQILSPIVNRGGAEMTEGTFNGIMQTVMKDTVKKYGSGAFVTGMARGAAEEFPEEALDQFVNTFIEDAATDDDTPLMDRLHQSLMAGLQGAVMGAGVPAAQNVAGAFTAKQRLNEMGGEIENQFYVDVAAKLADTDSPLTARFVQQLAEQPARKREAMITEADRRISAYKKNKQEAAEAKALAAEASAAPTKTTADIVVNGETIPANTDITNRTVAKIDEANREEQLELTLGDESLAPLPEAEKVTQNTDGSYSATGTDSTVAEEASEEILVSDFTDILMEAYVDEEAIQEFEAFVISKEEEGDDGYKPQKDWETLWEEFSGPAESEPFATEEEAAAEPTPVAEESTTAETTPAADGEPAEVPTPVAKEATPRKQRAAERRNTERLNKAANDRFNKRVAQAGAIVEFTAPKPPSQIRRNERLEVTTEAGTEYHRVIGNEPASYAIEEIHDDLFSDFSLIGEDSMLPNEVTPALDSDESRIITMLTPEGVEYYIVGPKDDVNTMSRQIPKTSAIADYQGANVEDASIIVYPSAEVTTVTSNDSMADLDDPVALRAIEQEANNRLMEDPFDRGAAIQKDYIQKKLRAAGEQTVDQLNADSRKQTQGKKDVARALKSIKAAAKAQKEAGVEAPEPRRQLTPTEMKYAAPQAYLDVVQGQQIDELSDDALGDLVPVEQIAAGKIPAIKQGLAEDTQDLKQKQVERLRNIIFLGYPVGVNAKTMYGLLPQSQAKVGGYKSVIEGQTGENISGYQKYFRLKIAEKINTLYPKIDLRKEAGVKGSTIDPAYDPLLENIAKRKIIQARPYSYEVNEDGEVELNADTQKTTSYYVDADEVGIFNNDPVGISQMLIHGTPIKIPKEILQNNGSNSNILARQQINPSIRYDRVTGEVFRVVKPAEDGVGVVTIERKSAVGEVLPDTGYSDLTYEVNDTFNNIGMKTVSVENAKLSSDIGPVATEHYVVTNKAKEKYTVGELQAGFKAFASSAMRGLSNIKSEQQREYDALEKAQAEPEGGAYVEAVQKGDTETADKMKRDNRRAQEENARRAAYYMSDILNLGDSAGFKKLTHAEASGALAAFVSEYEMALNMHGVRTSMVNAGHVDAGENVIKPSREASAVQMFKELSGKEQDIETLVTSLGGRMIAPQKSYSVTSKAYLNMSTEEKSKRNDAVILAYLNTQVIDGAFLRDGFMPTMRTVANRAKDRFLGQRKKQGDEFYSSADFSLQSESDEVGAQIIGAETIDNNLIPETAASNEPEFSGSTSTEGLPKGITDEVFVKMQKDMLLGVISESNEAVIETIETDPLARGAFIDMLRRTTHFGQNRADYFYDKMNVAAEWSALSGAVSHASYEHSSEILTFIKGLKQSNLASGLDLRSTIKYVMFPQNVSNSYASKMQPYLVSLGVVGPDPSFLPQVKAILNATSKVLRTRYAMTATTESQRAEVVDANTAEAEALGLVNGDPASVVAALNNIATESNNDSHKLVAELLLEDANFIQSVDFHISENSTLVPAQHTKNSDGSHTVSINLGGSNGRGLENVLLEEYIHAFLSDVVARPDASLTPAQRSGISRLKGLMQIAQDAYTKSGDTNESIAYQFKNMDEFVAGLLLNPEFQTFIKGVETPSTQRGLFKRIADAIVSLFQRAAGKKKITPAEATSYADAVQDVIDLAQSEANSGRQNMIVGVSSAINESAAKTKASGLAKFGMDGSEDLSLTQAQAAYMEEQRTLQDRRAANTRTAQREARDAKYTKGLAVSDIEPTEMGNFISNDIIPFIRAFTPLELRLVVDHDLKSAMGQTGNVIYINPARLASEINKISGDGVNNRESINLTLLSILDEEVGHYASFNQLTQKEIDDMGDSLGIDALSSVARRYFQNPTDAGAAIARLNSADPEIALKEKRNMVEEHLRMQLQRATRGFTSEEDIAFYQTNPPMLKILFRYLQGYMKSVTFRYRNRKEKPMAPINRLIAEMRQVKAGYRAGSNIQLFDANNPTANLTLLNAMLNEPIVTEVEEAIGLATMEQEVDAGFGIQGSSAGDQFMGEAQMSGRMARDIEGMPDSVKRALQRNEYLGFDSAEQAFANLSSTEKWYEVWEVNSPTDQGIINRYLNKINDRTYQDKLEAQRLGLPILYSSVGLDERMFGERSIEFAHVPQMFEVPFMKAGEYRSPRTWVGKIMSGDAEPRLTRLFGMNQSQINEGVATLNMFDTKFKKLIKETFGEPTVADNILIGKAVGTNAGLELSKEVTTELNDERQLRLDAVFNNKDLNAEGKNEARQEVYDLMDAKRDSLLSDHANSLRVVQENALNEIRVKSPELAKYIGIMRTELIDTLSKLVGEKYGLGNTPLGIRIDNQLGLYITRTYKMFTEAGYHEKLRKGVVEKTGDYDVIRTEAIRFFNEQFVTSKVDLARKNNTDEAAAKAEAEQYLVNNPSFGYDALIEFIDSYENPAVRSAITNSDGYRVMMDNLKEKKGDASFPKELRAVLGENTNEEAGLTNLLLTYGTVMNMVANQSLLVNIATIGRAENVVDAQPEDKFLMTHAERQEAMKKDPDKYSKWVTAKDRSSRNDPLAGLFAPPEMWDHLKVLTDKKMQNEMISSAEQTARTVGVIAAKMTGITMGIKTLGSFGFYLRNVMSNILYFGPSQGFYNMPKMLKSASKHLSQTLLNPDAVDAQIAEYTGLEILGENMNTRLLADLVRGHVEVDDIKKTMRELEEKAGPLDKVSKVNDARKAVIKKLTDMANAVDGFYKIAYFEHELKVVEEAVQAAPAGSGLASMKDSDGNLNVRQMKVEAARKVLMTAQFSSQRVAIAKEASTNAFGLLFSPFIGFTSDVFRIPVNTVKLGLEEYNSGNDVYKKRGAQRLAGLGIVMGGISAALPAALSGILGGLDDEEQNALRESLPEYLRSHSMFYWRWNGKLQSTDLTYVNPYAMVVDPFVRAFEKTMMGDYRAAAAAMTVDFLGDSFLSDQILAGAIWDLKGNRDSSTGEKIYDSNTDDIGDITAKTLGYVYKKAAEPNTFLKIKEAWQRKGLDTENFNDSSMGQLASMFYPAKVHTVDLDRSFRRMLYGEKQSASNSKSQIFEVYQSKPMTPDAVADIYFDHYDRQTRLDSRMFRFLNAYEKMGMSQAHMRHTLVKAGYGKRRADNILNGISEAPSLSPKMMQSLEERGLLDRAGPLYQAASEVPRWRLLDPR